MPAIFAYLLAGPHVLELSTAAPCISITEGDRHLTFREIGLSLNYFFYHNISNSARINSYWIFSYSSKTFFYKFGRSSLEIANKGSESQREQVEYMQRDFPLGISGI